jgi:hypothetical protein
VVRDEPFIELEEVCVSATPIGDQPIPSAPYTFRHTPPVSLPSQVRWPGRLQHQGPAFPVHLHSLVAWIVPFLSQADIAKLAFLNRDFQVGPVGYPYYFYRPWSPLRRRRWGFGIPSKHRSSVSSRPQAQQIFHHAWTYLTPQDRFQVAIAYPVMHDYVALRSFAVTESIASLKHQRLPPGKPKKLDPVLAHRYGAALLRFNFVYGDMIRWLGGEYTNRHRDWQQIFNDIESRPARPAPAHVPPADKQRAFHIFSEGVPVKGEYTSPVEQIKIRDAYDNHPAIAENQEAVEAKFAAEEEKTFHIHFPRFLIWFVYGLFLAPLQWAVRKGKGRICVDCTKAGVDEVGSINTQIGKPGIADPDECPPVYYGDAFMRFIMVLWRMRLSRPFEDILCHCDDIDAAFRRILYHPDMAIAFAYVFNEYLIVPVGQVFGSRSAPSFFSLTSDIRAWIATTHDIPADPLTPLAQNADLEPLPPLWNPVQDLTPACPDPYYEPLSANEEACFLNATFVDDNGIAAYRDRMLQALHQSVVAAYEVYGFPGEDRRQACINDDKWDKSVSHIMRYLGFMIDTRAMTVTWPFDKREDLQADIEEALAQRRSVAPRLLARILGKVESASLIAPWGVYITSSVRLALNKATRTNAHRVRAFWHRGVMRLFKSVITDLHIILVALAEPEWSPTWTRLIGTMIPRTATHEILSDASYGGMGGWSPQLSIKWRVLRQELVDYGFSMKTINSANEPADLYNPAGTHINLLEFVAVVINLWIALKLLARLPAPPTGFILELIADNTSALSWLKFAATTENQAVRALARLTSCFLMRASNNRISVQQSHIAGPLNVEADCLSRLHKNGLVPAWTYVHEQCNRLIPCYPCLLPCKLISSLAELTTNPQTVVAFETLATELLTLEVTISSDTLPAEAFSSTISQ